MRAIEWLANTIIDGRADSLSSLTRTQLAEEKAAPASTRSPKAGAAVAAPKGTGEKIVESTSVNLKFSGSPAAVRRIVNQIASVKDQFYILRTLIVKNQADKGPKRGAPDSGADTDPERCRGKRQGGHSLHCWHRTSRRGGEG